MPPSNSNINDAKYILVPVSIANHVSWKGGAEYGPKKIIEASAELEYYNFESMFNINNVKYFTLPQITSFEHLSEIAKKFVKDGSRLPIFIGGDHSISIPIMEQLSSEVVVVHFDAHFDMRREYLGDPLSHACAMYNVSKNHEVIHVGVRSGCEEDLENVKKFGNKIVDNPLELIPYIQDKNVYISFDVDVFDPSIIPATGTPEPNGLKWEDVINYMKIIFQSANVIGIDVVELSPRDELFHADATIAKLIFRMIEYHDRY